MSIRLPKSVPPFSAVGAKRRMMAFLLSILIAVPAIASKRVTVAQLEQGLNAAISAHKSDEETARRMADSELTERLTDASLERLKVQLGAHPLTLAALQILADQSSFLDPPPNELPTIATPDDVSQKRMLYAANSYVAQTLQRLPNFLATRTITRFDDSPRALKQGGWGVRQGLWQVDTSHQEISVRVERESQPPAESSAVWQGQIGLISGGEFGTTLGMIMTDTAGGTVAWSHWEQSEGNPIAVFKYTIPRAASHFQVIGFRERAELVGFGSVTRGSAPSRVGVQPGDPSNTKAVHTKPGYHGSFWLDPATGTVLRITLQSDSKEGAPFRSAGILVQYAPVRIGEGKFICPTRSLAFSTAVPDPQALTSDAPTEWLNVALFSGYHLFASTTRILPEALPQRDEKHDGASEAPQIASLKQDQGPPVAANTTTPPDPVSDPSTPPTTAMPSAPLASSVADAATAAQPPPSTPAVGPATPSSLGDSVAEPADQPRVGAHASEINVNRVLIPVLVRDRNGHAVSGLKEEDFGVLDNDAPRPISRFLIEERGGERARPPDGQVRGQQSQSSPAQALPRRIIVFLFDDLHLGFEDLSYTRKAASKAFEELGDLDLAAVVTTSGKTNSGLTHDLAELRKALMALQPQGIYSIDANDCPKIGYYQADLIENKHDNTALQDAITQVVKICNPRLPLNFAEEVVHRSAGRTLILGSQDVRSTYSTTREFVRRMAKMPGERTLVMVSSGFLNIEQESRSLESGLIDLATQSNVAISAIDARGLYTDSLTARDDTRGRVPDQVADYRRTSMKLAEDPMAELADGTGGTFFHNSNDLDAGFKRLTEVSETVYLLEIPIDNVKQDGSYHRLKVKLNQGGLDVNARHGYLAPKLEKSKK